MTLWIVLMNCYLSVCGFGLTIVVLGCVVWPCLIGWLVITWYVGVFGAVFKGVDSSSGGREGMCVGRGGVWRMVLRVCGGGDWGYFGELCWLLGVVGCGGL